MAVTCSVHLNAQTVENRGTADLTVSGVTGQLSQSSPFQTSGLSVAVTDFLPHFGLLEAGGGEYLPGAGVKPSLSFVRLSNVRFRNERISITGGDFSFDPYPLPLPFSNISTPALQLNGFLLESRGISHRVRIFGGEEILLEGIRIPLVYSGGQKIVGGDARFDITKNISAGGRVIWFSTQSQSELSSVLAESPAQKPLPAALSSTLDLTWRPIKPLQLVSEIGYSKFQQGADVRWHPALLGGVVLEFNKFKAHATYIQQPISYLPVASYYTGARTGEFADLDYRATSWLDAFASWTTQDLSSVQYPYATGFHGESTGLGLMLSLPLRTSVSAQYLLSTYNSSQTQQSAATLQTARLTTIVASHPFRKRNTAHLNILRLETSGTLAPSGQTSFELQDDVQFHYFTVTGAARLQQNTGQGTRTGVYFSGGVQGTLKSLTFFEHLEAGSDLASKTLFATSVTQSNTFGVQYRFRRTWNIGADAWRSRLTTNLTGDPAATLTFTAPVLPVYSSNNQWTVFFKLTQQLSWGGGGGHSSQDIARYAEQSTPRVGSITGTIFVLHPNASPSLAHSVTISLDGYRTTMCDQYGKYTFGDVREGPHTIQIDERKLPVEFAPAEGSTQSTAAQGQHTTIVNFTLHATARVEGTVKCSDSSVFGLVYVKLQPGGQYTLVESDGHFSLESVPEGDYTVSLFAPNLTGDVTMQPESIPVSVTAGKPQPLEFTVTKHIAPIPIRGVEIKTEPPVKPPKLPG